MALYMPPIEFKVKCHYVPCSYEGKYHEPYDGYKHLSQVAIDFCPQCNGYTLYSDINLFKNDKAEKEFIEMMESKDG